MAQKIFVNLPVRDLKKSMEFFHKLGFTFNPQFTDETAACMTATEDIFVMLLTENKFKAFTPKQICDATKSTEALVCLSSLGRDEVTEMVRKAVAAGGTTYKEPQDHGFMYSHGFQDLDGHIWELVFRSRAQLSPRVRVRSNGDRPSEFRPQVSRTPANATQARCASEALPVGFDLRRS